MKNRTSVFFLLFFCFNSTIDGQSLRDHTWVLGYSTLIPGALNQGNYGGMYVTFSKNAVHIDSFEFKQITLDVPGCANDEQGNLAFYTSGCTIFDKNNDVMENGDDIIIGGENAIYKCTNFGSIPNLLSSTLILPIPSHPDQYLNFQLRVEEMPDGSGFLDKFFYSTIDMSANNGLGKVVAKHQIALDDSLHDAVAAVRHGNGRDWWIVMPRGTNRQFWELLISPEGVTDKILRTLPPQDKFNITFKEADPPFTEHLYNEYTFEQWGGQAIFSPDGTKYARIVMGNGVEIFDFDRCTGEMSLLRTIPMPPDSIYIAADLPIFGCGLAFSPSSRYLYFSNNLGLFQFDMCAENIKNGSYIKIDYFDGFSPDGFVSANFFQMRNAPDGKIYINSTNGTNVLHVIESPDKAGKACNFRQHALELPKWNFLMGNYFPNFNLYDVADSPCDTLGIDDPNPKIPLTFDALKIFPNPANQEVNIYIPRCEGAKISIWNIAGQLVAENTSVTGEEAFAISTKDWAAGMYVIAVYLDGNKPEIRKLVVTH